ncbi:MAG: hypothetical protein JW797_12740 [Bradymonadales bacterium]|nr:hypothetical protein [Bradymonadales bacterium]
MKRANAIKLVAPFLEGAVVINCNGMISREVFTCADSPTCFYMVGSMGLAGPIGLGVALSCPDRRVVVMDGDGNVLMNAGVLGNIAVAGPTNLFHLVLDNSTYGSTGDQRTISPGFSLAEVARAFGYRRLYSAQDEQTLTEVLPPFFGGKGPCLLHVLVEPGNVPDIARVNLTPIEMTERIRRSLAGSPRSTSTETSLTGPTA